MPPSREQLEQALINADKAGDTEAAQALAQALRSYQARPANPAPSDGSFANSVANGMSFGLADELAGLGGAVVGSMLPESMGGLPSSVSFGDAYRGIRDAAREDKASFEQRNPVTAAVGEVAGSLLTGGAGIAKLAPKLAPAGASLVTRLGAYGGTGAAEGAIAGFGNAGEDDKLKSTVTGALVGGVLGAAGGEVANVFTKRSAVKEKVADMFARGETNTLTAKYTLDGAGKVKVDRAAKEAIKQGFDEGTVAVIKGSSATDARKMMRMLQVQEDRMANKLYGVNNRPSDIVGDSIAERLRHVLATKNSAASKLDDVAASLKGQTVDYNPAVNTFIDDLSKMGVKFDGNKIDFMGSDLEGVKGAQNIIKRTLSRMTNTKVPDAYDVHRLKRFIDEHVEYGKKATGLGGKTERIITKLRHNLDAALDSAFPEYNAVNTQFFDATKALEEFQEAAGKSINLFGDNSDKALGTLSRRLMSNYQNRVKLLDSMKRVEDTARKYGGQFDDDVMSQVLFMDELDSMFGATARASLQGETQKGVQNAAKVMGQGALANSVDAAGTILERARGINRENAIKSMKEILRNQGMRSSASVNSSSLNGVPRTAPRALTTP